MIFFLDSIQVGQVKFSFSLFHVWFTVTAICKCAPNFAMTFY